MRIAHNVYQSYTVLLFLGEKSHIFVFSEKKKVLKYVWVLVIVMTGVMHTRFENILESGGEDETDRKSNNVFAYNQESGGKQACHQKR